VIYEAASDDEAFQALPQLIREACDARSVVIHYVGAEGGHASLAHTGHWSLDEIALYGAYSNHDVVLQASARPDRLNQFWNLTTDFVTPEQMRRSAIHEGFYRAIGDDTRHVLGAAFAASSGFGAIGIHRGEGASTFGDGPLGIMREVQDDLRRMLRIRSRLLAAEEGGALSRAVLGRLSTASLQTDRNGRVLALNAAADALAREGRIFGLRGGVLAFMGSRSGEMERAIRLAADPVAPMATTVSLPREGGSAIVIAVSPLTVAGGTRALLIFGATGPSSIAEGALQRHYGLSPSEARIAIDLARGGSVAGIAARRSVSEATVRTQVKAILGKTGCERQGELIALILNLPPVQGL